MLQGLLPLSTAGLAALGLSYTARGSATGLLLLAAATLILLWSDVRLLLVGLREIESRAARAVALGVYPLGSMATCIFVVGGLLLLGREPLAAIAVAALAGGSALRLLVGVIAVTLVMKRLPPALRDPLREALAFR